MPKVVTLTQTVIQKITIKPNKNVFVLFGLADANGKIYETQAVQFLFEEADPPTDEPVLSPPERNAVNLLLDKITGHLEDFLEDE